MFTDNRSTLYFLLRSRVSYVQDTRCDTYHTTMVTISGKRQQTIRSFGDFFDDLFNLDFGIFLFLTFLPYLLDEYIRFVSIQISIPNSPCIVFLAVHACTSCCKHQTPFSHKIEDFVEAHLPTTWYLVVCIFARGVGQFDRAWTLFIPGVQQPSLWAIKRSATTAMGDI